METLHAISMSNGIAIGELLVLAQSPQDADTAFLGEETEWNRYCDARTRAMEKLRLLAQKTLCEVGEEAAGIFEMHEMLIEDEDFTCLVHDLIRNNCMNAAEAALKAGCSMAEEFESLESEYMRARAVDFRDISGQIAVILRGQEGLLPTLTRPVILAAEDLTPSQTMQLDVEKVLAFVTHQGSANSHTAILARSLQIPALFGIKPQPGWSGKTAVLDGQSAQLILEPDETVLSAYRRKQDGQNEQRRELQTLIGKPNVTKDGRSIQIFANAGSLEDLDSVCANDAGGIGLFRTEFIFMRADSWPSEEDQFSIYRSVLERMRGKPVIFRTVDIGADKQAAYFNRPREENPAMGVRGVRLCLQNPEIFRTQLRALFRASVYGKMSVMYPMITSLEEVRRIRTISAGIKKSLMQEDIPVGEPEEGIMIETPAAALISDLLAPYVDFFSIGSNDLTQYTLALDRQNTEVMEFFLPHHEAVLRLIQLTVENARKAGIWCGICGELGADPALTEQFIDFGVHELSVVPGSVLPLRRQIREMDTIKNHTSVKERNKINHENLCM